MLAKNEQATENATAVEVEKKISGAKLKALLKAQRSGQDDIDEIKGKMGKPVAEAVEKYNLNTKMFGWIKQLDRMAPERLADNIDDFLHMLDASGLSDRAKTAQRLPIEDGGEAE